MLHRWLGGSPYYSKLAGHDCLLRVNVVCLHFSLLVWLVSLIATSQIPPDDPS